jgi:lipid A 3-O-deacylase
MAKSLWVGIYQHDVTLAQQKFETGQDIKAGWIGDPIAMRRANARRSSENVSLFSTDVP